MKRSLLCPFIAAILLCASTIHPQERPNRDQSAPDVVREVVNNELNTRKEDHIHWMYQLETDKAGAGERIKFIETIEGNLTRLHSEWRSIALRLAPWSLVLFAPNKCLLVYDSFAFRTIAREKSHEPTMATDVFLAGIQEQEPLPRSGLLHSSLLVAGFLFAQGDEDLRKREYMVQTQIAAPRGSGAERVRDSSVLDSMRKTPRDRFVPAEFVPHAYDDRPLPIGYGQTISQPYIVAKMTELLEPKREHQVLEIGSGSGYQAAVLSPLVAHVYTIEIIEPLGTAARKRLAALGYKNVEVRVGDGYFGWPERAPFDGIIVTAAANHIPPALVEQLKPGGRMVIPVGNPFQTQMLMLVTKGSKGPRDLQVRNLMPVAFVPLVGGPRSN